MAVRVRRGERPKVELAKIPEIDFSEGFVSVIQNLIAISSD